MLLLRHASAGHRLASPSLDRARPLDRAGWDDARLLPAALARFRIDRIVTSPHVRCVQSLAPLVHALRVEAECRDALAPGASATAARALLDELGPTTLVCTHREVIERLFDGEIAAEKGGAWLLERDGDQWRPVEYLPPPTKAWLPRRAVRVS
jgi:phosphohistidine phosphatase SixA